jgi:hypothetical protein
VGWLQRIVLTIVLSCQMHPAHQAQLPDQGEVKLRRAAKLTELLVEEPVNLNNRRHLVMLKLISLRLFVRSNLYVIRDATSRTCRWQLSDPARLASGGA